jgi:molybdenum cofactor biosynthesis protein B
VAVDPSRSFKPINIAVLTVSDTRTAADDTSGDIVAGRIISAGHALAARAIVRDDPDLIVAQLEHWIDDPAIDAVVCTGGTGLTGRDVTPEALDRIKTRDIPGFGELFRWISFQTIGTSTIQSRACAVVARGTYIFALPGSNGAVKDGWDGILAEQPALQLRRADAPAQGNLTVLQSCSIYVPHYGWRIPLPSVVAVRSPVRFRSGSVWPREKPMGTGSMRATKSMVRGRNCGPR